MSETILPQSTTVELFTKAPFEADYENTAFFPNEQAQNEWFTAYKSHISDGEVIRKELQSYHRWDKGTIRIEELADNVYNCNYMRFKNNGGNTRYSNKWFYAFIIKPTYIGENCTEIQYEIDYMQTWLPSEREVTGSVGSKYIGDIVNENDYDIGTVFVEREHSIEDIVYDNRVQENLPCGEYVANGGEVKLLNDNPKANISLMFIFPLTANIHHLYDYTYPDGPATDPIIIRPFGERASYGDYYVQYNSATMVHVETLRITDGDGNIYTYETYSEGTKTVLQGLDRFLTQYPTFGTQCVASYHYPYNLFGDYANIQGLNEQLPSGNYSWISVLKDVGYANTEFQGYTPKNRKLYCYPYRKIIVDNGFDKVKEYKYEGWNLPDYKNKVAFNVFGTYIPSCNLTLVPSSYFGATTDYTEMVQGGEMPSVPLSIDAFNLWKQKNQFSVGASLITNALKLGLSATGVTAGSAQSAVSQSVGSGGNIASSLAEIADRYFGQEDRIVNFTSSDLLRTAQSRWQMNAREYTIRKEFAQIIDNYFDKYGYATKLNKYPNLHSRPHWNYVKTIGCFLHDTKMPVIAEKKICEIFNKGITFWKYAEEMGDYTQLNIPTNS